jgi:cobalamin-dependent methionine synthase I
MFVIVGERINTSRARVMEAVEKRDTGYIQEDVRRQEEAGATYIDVNAGAQVSSELEDLKWLLNTIQDVVSIPLCIDSANPEVIEGALDIVKKPPMINSISLERNRFESMLAFLKGKDCRVVALCVSDEGMPKSSDEVIGRAGKLIEGLEGIGMERDRIYVDPLIQPISTDISKGVMAMESVRGIMEQYPGVHTICGLSNVSFGLPERRIINRSFLPLLMTAGLDAAILDPLDDKIMTVLKTTLMLLGNDPYCMEFIKAVRAGEIIS